MREKTVDQTNARPRGSPGFSEAELSSSPVSPLSVVPDFVVSLVSDPVWHWSVLLDLLGKSDLLSECLNGTLQARIDYISELSTYHIPLY